MPMIPPCGPALPERGRTRRRYSFRVHFHERRIDL
jgi:hypothetical protein